MSIPSTGNYIRQREHCTMEHTQFQPPGLPSAVRTRPYIQMRSCPSFPAFIPFSVSLYAATTSTEQRASRFSRQLDLAVYRDRSKSATLELQKREFAGRGGMQNRPQGVGTELSHTGWRKAEVGRSDTTGNDCRSESLPNEGAGKVPRPATCCVLRVSLETSPKRVSLKQGHALTSQTWNK